MAYGAQYCTKGPNGKGIGFCNCYCAGCHPDNPPSKHCKNHYYDCHRICGRVKR